MRRVIEELESSLTTISEILKIVACYFSATIIHYYVVDTWRAGRTGGKKKNLFACGL
jgi:hypothetical protein